MTTVADLKYEIIRHLGDEIAEDVDPIEGSGVTTAELLGGIQAALRAVTVRLWKPATLDIAVDEAGIGSVSVPADLISVEAIYDETNNIFLPRLIFTPGNPLIQDEQNAWIDYPSGSITFLSKITSGGTVYYSAHWAVPALDTDTIEAPLIAMSYLTLYATSYILLGKASAQAEIRQYATKVDSGNPIMLPAKELSNYFLQRAEIELKSLPNMVKGG